MRSSAADRTGVFRERPAPEREADVLRVSVEAIRNRLPSSWAVDERLGSLEMGDARVDGELHVGSPDGAQVVVLVEAKRLLSTRDVPIVLDGLARAASGWSDDQEVLSLVTARYLAPG